MKSKLNRMPLETMQCKCNVCRKELHIEEAKYCTRCGTELNLNQTIRRTGHHFH